MTDGSRFNLEAKDIDKRNAFFMKDTIATLMKRSGQKWHGYHFLSLSDVFAIQEKLPCALEQYLAYHLSVNTFT